ncbi:MAG: Gfo/Idh/MocA family protein [Flavobacteriales bacterium]
MNVLIVGLGSIARKHIKALREIDPEVRFFALRSSKTSKTEEGVENIFNFEDIKALQLDFCIISSPTSVHFEHIKLLTPLNIPLFIEKPLSHTLEVECLKNKLAETKTYVACNLRFLDALRFVKDKMLSDSKLIINEVQVYCGSYLPDWRPGVDFRSVYSAIPELGGGVHLDLIHELDYVYWLFGKPDKNAKSLHSKSSLDIQSVDFATYQLSYNTFECLLSLNYFRRKPKREIEIVCNAYTIRVDLLTNTVYKDEEVVFESEQTILDTYKTQLEYFISENKPFNDFNEALEVLSICLKEEKC